jgi:hypothetical protein
MRKPRQARARRPWLILEHRPEKLVAGLNPAIPVFGQADAQKQRARALGLL